MASSERQEVGAQVCSYSMLRYTNYSSFKVTPLDFLGFNFLLLNPLSKALVQLFFVRLRIF